MSRCACAARPRRPDRHVLKRKARTAPVVMEPRARDRRDRRHVVAERFLVERWLGERGMGVVFEALDEARGDRVGKTLARMDGDAIASSLSD